MVDKGVIRMKEATEAEVIGIRAEMVNIRKNRPGINDVSVNYGSSEPKHGRF